jgi:hypothetical protein
VRVNEQSFPVTVVVRRSDGSKENVRVGTAVRSGDGFSLTLGELSIGAVADAPSSSARRSSPPAGDNGMVFPPYGRSKGAPIAGAALSDLEFYMNGCRRTLGDPAKARWHDKERVLLAAIEAEIERQRGAGDGGGDHDDGGSFQAPPDDYDSPPPHSDDDIPF